jgi:hypothetical protein
MAGGSCTVISRPWMTAWKKIPPVIVLLVAPSLQASFTPVTGRSRSRCHWEYRWTEAEAGAGW